MKKFKKGSGFNNNKFDGSRGDRRDRFEHKEMFHAICSECGRDCQVPFKPGNGKPVFCSSCFSGKGGNSSNYGGKRPSGRNDFGDKRMYDAVCAECGQDCQVPFRPSGDKDIYCSICFDKREKKGSVSRDDSHAQLDKQLSLINEKLNRIMEILGSGQPEKPKSKTEAVKQSVVLETVEKKIETKKKPSVKKSAKPAAAKKTSAKKKTASEKTSAKKKSKTKK